MFIKEDLADKRVDSDENLVNLVLNISKRPMFRETESAPDLNGLEETKESDSERELAPVIVGRVDTHNFHGRKEDGKNVGIELRHAAGLLAQTDTIKNVSAALGISMNTVAMAKHGATVHNRENPELKARLDNDLAKVRDKALERLLSSLDLLDDEKIEKCSAKDISGISANMAKVMQSTLPKESEQNIRAQLIVYAPTQINENRYESVEI